MLGWDIFIKDKSDTTIANWVVGLGGLDWLRKLEKDGFAESLESGGYPTSYKLLEKHVIPFLKAEQLPDYEGPFVIGDDYVRSGGMNTNIKINEIALNGCKEDDYLFVIAWDQS